LLLYRRWKEADEARAAAADQLRTRTTEAAASETAARQSGKTRQTAEDALPPLREEEAIAAAVLQRLIVQRDTLTDQEARANQTIETLTGRIEQLARDMAREAELNKDAGETIDRLEWEAREIAKASEGHDARLEEARVASTDGAQILADREADLSQMTEDVARLAARHQSAQRLIDDYRKTLEKNETEAQRAIAAKADATAALAKAAQDFDAAKSAEATARATAEKAEAVLAEAEAARADTQNREADARALRSEAEGEANALRAETAALSKLVDRDSSEGSQILDQLKVKGGYEKALGAALSDDLKAPAVTPDMGSGWVALPGYNNPQALPNGVQPLTKFVSVPLVLERRMGQVGLVDAADGARLQKDLSPGQRLVSVDGDLWRWDGFRAAAEDAPSAAALRLQQLNRLEELKKDLNDARPTALWQTPTAPFRAPRLTAI